jgi:uncharacterized membrane protein
MSEQDDLRALRELVAQLTARVYRLEQVIQPSAPPPPPPIRIGAVVEADALMAGPKPPSAEDRSGPMREANAFRAAASNATFSAGQQDSLERRIGSQWLNRVGVVAVLVGVSYFLKLAFDYGWITPGMRVLLGMLAGAGLCWWSERFRRPNSLAFSYSLKAVGVGVLYLSLWASFQLYHLLPGAIAFLAMVLVTAFTAAMAFMQDAELLAGLALLGGLLTPVLCATNENHEAALFCYVLLLSAGAFVLQRVKPWPRILLGAFVGSVLLGGSWYETYYTGDQFSETLLFFSLLFALFAVAPLYSILEPERDGTTRTAGLLLAIWNAVAYFAGLCGLLERSNLTNIAVQPREAAYALSLAVVYGALAVALDRRVSERPGVERLVPIVHYGIAVTFLTVGIALKLHQHWITLAWLVEGALLFWAGASTARRRLKLFAGAVVVLGLVRLLVIDLEQWGVQPTVLNPRLVTMAVAIGVLVWMIYLDCDEAEGEMEGMAIGIATVAVNLLALLAIGLEIHDTFATLLHGTVYDPRNPRSFNLSEARHGLTILRNFCYSALFMLYGAGLMWLGFARSSGLLRWQAIVLIAFTVVKVFVFDAWALEHGWRVLSFIILGAILLAVSYAYQRDWLGLQRTRSG